MGLAATRGDVLGLNVQYGSVHNERELWFARMIARYYMAELIEVTMPASIFGTESALMSGDIPEASYVDGPQPTVVPFRNANLISIAVAIAEQRGIPYVYAGMHASDHSNWAYPDCSPEFLGAMANAVYVGTMHKVRLVFPFVWLTKAGVVEEAIQMNVPLDLTYSCYRGGAAHCGKCPTCLERKQAFKDAGYYDPTEYEEV